MADIDYIHSEKLKRLYAKFMRRKAHCPPHDGTWYKVDAENNAVLFNYRPLKTARRFHHSTAQHRAFGGGYGDGKSLALCMECLTMALEYPGTFGLIGANTFPQLRDSTRKTFFEICPPALVKTFQKTENCVTLFNKSQIIFRPLGGLSEEERVKIKGPEYGFFAIDQAEGIDHEIYDMLRSRCRQPRTARRSIVVFNMEGHNWIWEYFVRDIKNKKRNPDDYELFVAASIENPYLPTDYVLQLLTDYPEEWVARYVEGSFEVFKGKIFRDFDDITHVIPQFEPPANWTRYRSIDWGMLNPTGVIWVAVNEENDIYVYGESYEKGLTVPAQAALIKQSEYNYTTVDGKREKCHFMATTIDPTTNRPDPATGETIKQMFDMADVITTNGNHDVNAGIDKLNQLFRAEKPGKVIRIMDNCTNLIAELNEYKWRPPRDGGAEKPLKTNDHLVDALRYLVMFEPTHYNYVEEDLQQGREAYFRPNQITGY